MFLSELKENIKINSKPFMALRNEVVKYLLAHDNAHITKDNVRGILSEVVYTAARYDIQNRFLSFSIDNDMDDALIKLIQNNHDLVHELHTLMPIKLDPRLSTIAYQRLLATDQVFLITADTPLEYSTDSFNEAQDFLSVHSNMISLAVHFQCAKRLGALIDTFGSSNKR